MPGRSTRSRRLRIALLATGAALLVLITGVVVVVTMDREPPRPAPLPPVERVFSADSPFNDRIGPVVQVDPDSAGMVELMTGEPPTVNVYDDVPPIYEADPSTPRRRLPCTMSAEWGRCPLDGHLVPVPTGAVASSGSDDNMVIIDRAAGVAFGFWQYRGDRVSWGEVTPLDGPGNHPPGATGSGISRLAGIVRTDEVRRGRIEHALVGATGHSCEEFRYPAVKSDGWASMPGCLPEGARLQLDPGVDCEGLPGAPPIEKMVCRALQEYGWYNIDNGLRGRPWFGIQFENPAGEEDPYPAAGVQWDHMGLTAIPWNRLRVLAAWDAHDGAPVDRLGN